jgi:hypothetical protein
VDIATIIIGAVAAVAAVVAAVVGVKVLRVSRDTLTVTREDRDLSRDTLTVSKEDLDISKSASGAANLDRTQRTLKEMGDTIEAIARWTDGQYRPQGFTGGEWLHDCIRLQHIIIGLESMFPNCQALAHATSRADAAAKVQMARGEVGLALTRLAPPGL